MLISSNCFFHFTHELKYLKDILATGFWPRYCKEYGWGNRYIDFALPMVCFCDIPLTLIKEHSGLYGAYGIGVSSQWIRENKNITPVQYISSPSYEFDSINRILTKLKNNTITENEIRKLLLAKKVSGEAINKKRVIAKKKFYDEREWRFVPPVAQDDKLIIPIEKGKDVPLLELSENTKKYSFKPEISDIRYLLIPNYYCPLKRK